jgi:hypothetical protein
MVIQWEEDKRKPATERQWLHFEVDKEGKEPLVVLASQEMLQTAIRWGSNQSIYCDATHGMQRYGLKVVTLHVKDNEGKGSYQHRNIHQATSPCSSTSCCRSPLCMGCVAL